MRGRFALGVAALLALTGCKTMADLTAPEMEPISWTADTVQGERVIAHSNLTLAFTEDGRVTGLAGVNRFSGPMKAEAGRLTLGPLASTKMAGAPELMAQEQKYLAVLEGAERYAFHREDLQIFSKGSPAPTTFHAISQDESAVIGNIFYHEQLALPPDASLEVRLVDVTRAGASPDVITSADVAPPLPQGPIPFVLRYDANTIDPKHLYAVQAKIFAAGRPLFVTPQAVLVLTQDHPHAADILVQRVDDSKVILQVR